MHGREFRDEARRLSASGLSVAQISRQLNLPYRTVWDWCRAGPRVSKRITGADLCFRCHEEKPSDPASYSYLLGLYLGDGYLVTSGRVPVLRIFCSDQYPQLLAACSQA